MLHVSVNMAGKILKTFYNSLLVEEIYSIVSKAENDDIRRTCFCCSCSHLMGAHGTRVVRVVMLEDLLYDQETQEVCC